MADVIPMKAPKDGGLLQSAEYHPGDNLNLLHLTGGPTTNGRTEGGGTPPGTPPPRTEGGGTTITNTNSADANAAASASARAGVVNNNRTEGGQGGEGGTATATNGGNALNLNQKMFYAPPAVAYDSGHQVCGGHNFGLSTIFGGISFGDSKPNDRCWTFMEKQQQQHLVDLACSSGINIASLAHDGYIKVSELAAQIAQRNPAARSEVAAMGALTTTEAIQAADLLKLCRDTLHQGLGVSAQQTVIGGISLEELPPPVAPVQVTPLAAPPAPHKVYHPKPHPKVHCDCEKPHQGS